MENTNEQGDRVSWIRRLLVVLSVVLLLLVAVLVVVSSRPPAEWMELKSGDPRGEVVAALGVADSDLRDIKGYEMWSAPASRYLGVAGRWQLLVTYDGGGGVESRSVSFSPCESAGYNRWVPGMVLYRVRGISSRELP